MHFIVVSSTIDARWLRRFIERHPGLSFRKPQPKKLSDEKKFDEEVATKFLKDLDDLDRRGYLTNPARIVNLDEIGFKLGSDDMMVIATRGKKRVELYRKGICLISKNIVYKK